MSPEAIIVATLASSCFSQLILASSFFSKICTCHQQIISQEASQGYQHCPDDDECTKRVTLYPCLGKGPLFSIVLCSLPPHMIGPVSLLAQSSLQTLLEGQQQWICVKQSLIIVWDILSGPTNIFKEIMNNGLSNLCGASRQAMAETATSDWVHLCLGQTTGFEVVNADKKQLWTTPTISALAGMVDPGGTKCSMIPSFCRSPFRACEAQDLLQGRVRQVLEEETIMSSLNLVAAGVASPYLI